MFANAYKKATKFTHPVIISTHTLDGEVKCGCGAFVLLNNEGWILTVAHILNSHFAFQKHQEQLDRYRKEVEKIENDDNLNENQKREKTGKLNPNKKWITNHSFWWGINGIQIEEFKLFYEGDIAIGQIKNFQPNPAMVYPKFKNPKTLLLVLLYVSWVILFMRLKLLSMRAKVLFWQKILCPYHSFRSKEFTLEI